MALLLRSCKALDLVNHYFGASLRAEASAEAAHMAPVHLHLAMLARARCKPIVEEDARRCACTSTVFSAMLGEITARYQYYAST